MCVRVTPPAPLAVKAPPAIVVLLKRSMARTELLKPEPRVPQEWMLASAAWFHWAMWEAAAPSAVVKSPPTVRWLTCATPIPVVKDLRARTGALRPAPNESSSRPFQASMLWGAAPVAEVKEPAAIMLPLKEASAKTWPLPGLVKGIQAGLELLKEATEPR